MSLTIISRDGWGSRGPKKPLSKLNKSRVKGIVLHHSGVKNGPKGVAAVRAFEKYHMDSNGWNAIAYNWLVDEVGVVYEGRGAGHVSAANRPWNSRTEAICYTGWGADPIPEATKRSIKALVDDIQLRYNGKLWVKGHRDLASTTCPERELYHWMQSGMPLDGHVIKSGRDIVIEETEHLRLANMVEKKPLSKRRRSRGEAVRVVQRRLNELGYDAGPVDGHYGPKSAAAVRAFQNRYRDFLTVDGIVGKNTWKMLFS
jgi:N-acetyl-anhydromuramyl-L-alanine amidase AmpD